MIYTQAEVDQYFMTGHPVAQYDDFCDDFDFLPEILEPHLFKDGKYYDSNGSEVWSATMLEDGTIEVIFIVNERNADETTLAYAQRTFKILGHLTGTTVPRTENDDTMFVIDSFKVIADVV